MNGSEKKKSQAKQCAETKCQLSLSILLLAYTHTQPSTYINKQLLEWNRLGKLWKQNIYINVYLFICMKNKICFNRALTRRWNNKQIYSFNDIYSMSFHNII